MRLLNPHLVKDDPAYKSLENYEVLFNRNALDHDPACQILAPTMFDTTIFTQP